MTGRTVPEGLPDAFRWNALGPNAYRIWLAAEHLHTPRELAEHLGIDPTTVLRKLKVLRDVVGLASYDAERRQWVQVMRDLDIVAEELEVQGSRARQKEYHRSERENLGAEISRTDSGGLIFIAKSRKKNR